MNKLRKLNTLLLTVLTVVLAAALLAACATNEPPVTPKKDITGVTFENATVNYDGNEHEITVSGTIPEGVNVSYTNNKGTDTGTYNATATLSGEEYNTLTLNATLKIVGTDITGITFQDATFPYDKQEHSISISGELPDGVTVVYQNNKATDYGVHTATATLSGKGYNTLTLTATLTIEAKDITGVTFANRTVTYNGSEYTIDTITGLPTGVTVQSITGNKATDVGTYTATAEIWGVGYKPLTLKATLTINPAEITGIDISDDTVTYDEQPHSIEIVGTLPTGVSVAYTYNGQAATSATVVGSYTVVATLSGKNYVTKTLSATLTIDKATITGVTLTGKNVEYDTFVHSLQVVGNVPAGVTTTYYYDGEIADGVSAVGKHEVTAVLSGPNHKTLELTANLTITASEEMLYSVYYNGYVYFQNNLDGNRLYRVTGNGTPTKVSNDVATHFTASGSKLFFYSASLFSQTVKTFDENGKLSVAFNPGRSTYLTSDGDGYIYYSKANLVDTKNENGIYKVKILDEDGKIVEDSTAVRLTTDKADYLAYYNGYIYYCNNSDSGKLYRISVEAQEVVEITDGIKEKLTDEKVSDIIVDGGVVYFAQHATLNTTIQRYNITTKEKKQLTVDNGAYLTKIGEYIYYVNKDLLTTHIYGKGIFRVSIQGGDKDKVLEDDGNGYYSLATDGTNLYYYKLNDKHIYCYYVSTEREIDLMRNFEPQETTSISRSPYASIATYNGEIYFTNVTDSNNLYKYNLQTKSTYKVLSDSVSNVYFNGTYMYYSTYIVTNYALWRVDLSNPEAVPEKISSSRYENLIFEGDHFYAIRVSPPFAYHNYIIKMNLDGTEETELYTERNLYIAKLYLVNGNFHFTINPASSAVSENIYTHALDDSNPKSHTNVGLTSNNFVISNGRYFYYNHKKNTFCSSDITNAKEEVITQKVDITDIYVYNGVIYYTSKSSQNTGIYAYNIASGTTTRLTEQVGHGFKVVDNQLYFVNIAISYTTDYPQYKSGDGHLYSINLSTNALTKIA
ncbi:MAG: DUF5050 domain-containing protein [Clostridiales bacterium]|nr:DUF5050 domain-containing protein [Clostridiales bacterium]